MTNNKIRLTSIEMSELSQNAKGLIMTTNKNFIGFSKQNSNRDCDELLIDT